MEKEVVLRLSREEALVLFELLSRHFEHEQPLAIEDPGETAALSLLLGALESTLVEPFQPDYIALVAQARRSLSDRLGVGE